MFDQTKDPGPSLMRRFGDLIRAPALTTPDAWAQANRVYGPETGLPGPRNPYLSPSMVPLGRAAVSGLYRRVVGVTGAQTGKTDTVLDVIGQRRLARLRAELADHAVGFVERDQHDSPQTSLRTDSSRSDRAAR